MLNIQDKLKFRVLSQVFSVVDHAEKFLLSDSESTGSLVYCKKLQYRPPPAFSYPAFCPKLILQEVWKSAVFSIYRHTKGVQDHNIESHMLKIIMASTVPVLQGFEFSVWVFY